MRKCDSVYNSGEHTEAHSSKVISNSLQALACCFLSVQTGSHVSKICTVLCSRGVLPSAISSLRCGHGRRGKEGFSFQEIWPHCSASESESMTAFASSNCSLMLFQLISTMETQCAPGVVERWVNIKSPSDTGFSNVTL